MCQKWVIETHQEIATCCNFLMGPFPPVGGLKGGKKWQFFAIFPLLDNLGIIQG